MGHNERSGSEPDSRAGCPVASTLATESLGSGKNKFLNSPKQVRLSGPARLESFAMRTFDFTLLRSVCRPGRDRNFQLSFSCRETTGLPIVLVLPRLPGRDEGLIFIEPIALGEATPNLQLDERGLLLFE